MVTTCYSGFQRIFKFHQIGRFPWISRAASCNARGLHLIIELKQAIMDETNLQPNMQPSPRGAQTHDLDADEIMFIGKNEDYFRDKWASRYPNGAPKIKWNWAAAFLGPVWLVYRKMYWQAVVYIVLCGLLSIAANMISPLLNSALNYAMPTTIGFCANRLYWEHMRQIITKLRGQNISEDLLHARLRNRGGINLAAALVGTAVMLIIGVAAFSALSSAGID
jgi:hypothetical protein